MRLPLTQNCPKYCMGKVSRIPTIGDYTIFFNSLFFVLYSDWGVEFGKGIRTQHLKEKDYIVVARQHYLRKMRHNRSLNNGNLIHPELQPIERCWGILKNEVARHCDFTLENLKRQLECAFDKITSETCQRIIKKVRSVEERFWDEDARLDREQENLAL